MIIQLPTWAEVLDKPTDLVYDADLAAYATLSQLSSALSPYLTSALAATTYVPQSRTITINGTTQDLTANRSWTISTTPEAGSITNSQLANVATATIKGRSTAGTGVLQDLTATQARGVLGLGATDTVVFGPTTVSAPLTINGGVQGSPSFSVVSNMINASNNLGANGLIAFSNGWGTLSGGQVSEVVLSQASTGPGGIALSPGTGANGNRVWIRNSTNAQRLELYGTFNDASNFRRLFLSSTTAGDFRMGVEGAGTGASGNSLNVIANFVSTVNASTPLYIAPGNSWLYSFSANEFLIRGDKLVRYTSGSDIFTPVDLGHCRSAAGVFEINNGNAGTLRDLSCRHITASGSQITLSGLPTTNPGVAGRLWNDGGTLKVS